MDRNAVVNLFRSKISKIIYDSQLELDFDVADERMFTLNTNKDLYFVLKFGQGQVNYALSDTPLTIECISQLDDVNGIIDILWTFLEENNFKTINGITLAFLTPQVTSNFNEIGNGYRASVYLSGKVRIPNSNKASVITKITLNSQNIEDFVQCNIHYSTQPDPQVFTNSSGLAVSLNRQKTISVAVSFYLGTDELSTIAKNAVNGDNLNTTHTLILYSGATAILSSANYIVTGVEIPQELGAYPLVTMTFTRA